MAAKEAALGHRVAADVSRQTTPVDDSEISGYVEAVGRRLAAVMPQREIRYSFAVIQDDPAGTPHEPLALPGGTSSSPHPYCWMRRTKPNSRECLHTECGSPLRVA